MTVKIITRSFKYIEKDIASNSNEAKARNCSIFSKLGFQLISSTNAVDSGLCIINFFNEVFLFGCFLFVCIFGYCFLLIC